ncbi:PPE family protein [Mycobacterium kansasii]|uniref:PPE family protein n=1 Tax=Mycobacterium kansasii TaxID=1768 RepID=A0A1V3XR83_MYCKA|nr:PPE family protein [Mycobacterium kansasii]
MSARRDEVGMVPEFAWLPPEINSARIFAGAGAGPLFAAASAWAGLAAELAGSASSFDAVIAGLTGGPWAGPASVSMAAAAAPYVGWLSAAAVQAETAAASAVAAATAFESAVAATVHPAAVAANRVLLGRWWRPISWVRTRRRLRLLSSIMWRCGLRMWGRWWAMTRGRGGGCGVDAVWCAAVGFGGVGWAGRGPGEHGGDGGDGAVSPALQGALAGFRGW